MRVSMHVCMCTVVREDFLGGQRPELCCTMNEGLNVERENILDRVVGEKEGKREGSGRAEEAGDRDCHLVGPEGTCQETKSEQ